MRVYLAADHAGFELKSHLSKALTEQGYEIVDVGAHEYDALDDYVSFCVDAAEKVVADPGSLGVVIGGSGNGEQIAANKVKGARAALAWNVDTAQLARQHNDALLVGIGARQHTAEEATEIVSAFLKTPFSGEPRHQRRIDQVSAYEDRA
ncbi:ribose-5-phosphate isomerase [Lentzea sp. BCCO 10_0798]|uniref:Ribose-5-phosphate isomerase B n=1 Tax=Lentzea kristufekii TaxID=3095430 RepID=A0ABU4TX72_9PSEU|nr:MULTISPECIES: ribose-5-phosphate isomerase [unclassified Lentzea]MCX2949581.1 ribose-5-phosphate isomerase [Lentzea sp. NEAU-D7]MDX8052899.1 ribose-5-phosphate isomerase [Lentzea sp. BCCO 10_0798]